MGQRPFPYRDHSQSPNRKYSQIDREAYAIVFSIKKFHQYLYANHFTLYTDHRPVTQIFSPGKSLPVYSAMRVQHYAIFLRGFSYDIKYKRSEHNGNADCLSRLPVGEKDELYDVIDIFFIEKLEVLSIDVFDIRKFVKEDSAIQHVISALVKGKAFSSKDTWNVDPSEFAVENNLLVRNHRMVIPKELRTNVLRELHVGHFGVVKMKGLCFKL